MAFFSMAFFGRIFLPFLLVVYIATETYLKLQHTSLCGEVGCKLAGELLAFDPLYLNYFGLVGTLLLILLGYLSLKHSLFEKLFFITLYGAIAFESTLISYQFIANPALCIFCLGIFGSLLLIALFSHLKNFMFIISSSLAIFIALHTLAVTTNQSFVTQEGNYLIASPTCSHCKRVKHYFKEHHIDYTTIAIDHPNAKAFLKFIDIGSIPLLIIKEKSHTTLIHGDKKIIDFFETQTVPPLDEAPQRGMSSIDIGFGDNFLATSEDEGCAITIADTPSCDDTNHTD